MKRWIILCLAALIAVPTVHCGDDAETGSTSGGNGTVEKLITAADGGTVEADGATIVIPPGALAEDTTITAKVTSPGSEPAADTIASSVYDLGPDGLQFLAPVTLTIDFAGTAPEGTTAQIAYLSDGAWVPLGDSAVSGTSVTATTDHFSTYAVVWVLGDVGGTCDALQFEAAGGDIVGTYDVSDICFEVIGALLPSCPDATISLTIDYTVVATFGADLSYSLTGTSTSHSELFLPTSCVGGTCPSEYTTVSGGCAQIEDKVDEPVDDVGTYAVSGTQVTLMATGATEGKLLDYSADGAGASLRTVPGPEDETFTILKLTRQ